MLNNISYASKYLGSYRILLELASNSSRHVYLGESVAPDKRNVAIKQFYTIMLTAQQDQENFHNDIRMQQQLNHPHILPVLAADIDHGMPYIVSTYAPNSSLRDRLQREAPEAIPQDEALTLLFQVGQALHYTHQKNIMHGNLKPQNILFDRQGMALLTDFKLPSLSDIPMTSSDDLVYVAPELSLGRASSKEGDQYALGSIAYEMFTGRKPFTTPSVNQPGIYYKTKSLIAPTRLNPALPAFIEQAILTAMAKEPAQRYRSVLEFLVALGVPPILTVPDGLILPNTGNTTLGLSTRQMSGRKPAFSLPKGTSSSSTTTFAQFSLAARTATKNLSKPHAVPPLRLLLARKSRGVRRFLPLLVTILVIIGAIGGIAFAFSFNQMQQKNNTLTVAPFQAIHPTPAPLQPTAVPTSTTMRGGGITVPTQPTAVPTAKPKQPATHNAPLPISTTATFSVTPTTLNATNCTPGGGSFTCNVQLSLANNTANAQHWYTYSLGVSAFFNPASGTITPGKTTKITITVFNTCTTAGTFVFVGPKTNLSVIWKC